MKIKDIYSFIDSIAPFSSAEEWDNVGLLVGDMDGSVQRAVVALDCTDEAIKAAEDSGAQLIITHHPAIFDPLVAVTSGTIPWLLAQKGISLISAHTNLDKAPQGVNAQLCQSLGLEGTSFDDALYAVALLPRPMGIEKLAAHVKSALGIDYLRVYSCGRDASKLALCCGSGGDCLEEAYNQGCDTLITGDIKHNVFVDAAHKGINLIDAGHFATEDIIVEPLAKMLRAKFPQIEFITLHTKPFQFI